METEELKRSQESYVRKVLELAKEVSRIQTQTSIRELYRALKDTTYGLEATIKGLQDLQKVYGLSCVKYKLREISEMLKDYASISRATSVEVLETMKAIIEKELESEETDKSTN